MGMGMLNADQVNRIANAVHALRSDWHPNGVRAVLADKRLRDLPAGPLAQMMVAVAVDETSGKPTRVFEAGPWWALVRPQDRPTPTSQIRRLDPTDCHECGRPKRAHPTTDCEYVAPGEPCPMPDDVRQTIASAIRAATTVPETELEGATT